MNKVQAKNITISLQVGLTYYPIICAKTGALSTDQEEIEITSINSGTDREYMPGMASHTLQVEGLTELTNVSNRISVFYLYQQSVRRSVHNLQIVLTDEEGDVLVLTCKGFVRTLTLSKQIGSFSSSGALFRITGPIGYSDVVGPPTDPLCEIADPIYALLAEGATSYTNVLLQAEGVEILGVWRSTNLAYTTGTPGNGQYSFDGPSGTIFLDPLNPINPGGEIIHVLYKVIA